MDNQRSPVVGAAVEIVGDTLLGLIGKCAEGTFAKVKVDHEDLLALDGQYGSEIAGDECLAGTDIEGCYHQDFAGLVISAHELKVSTHDAECLVDHIAASGLDDKLFLLWLIFLILVLALGKKFSEYALVLLERRKFAQERGRKVLEVLSATHGCVEHFL